MARRMWSAELVSNHITLEGILLLECPIVDTRTAKTKYSVLFLNVQQDAGRKGGGGCLFLNIVNVINTLYRPYIVHTGLRKVMSVSGSQGGVTASLKTLFLRVINHHPSKSTFSMQNCL